MCIFKKHSKVSKLFVESKTYAKQKEWYFTEAAKNEWNENVQRYFDEMLESWNEDNDEFVKAYAICGFSARKEHEELFRKTENWPAMFIKRYLEVCGYRQVADCACVGMMVADCDANKGEGAVKLTYPDIISFEKNPLLTVMKKIEDMGAFEEGEDNFWIFSDYLLDYIINAYRDGVDVSEEDWIYDKATYQTKSHEEDFDKTEMTISMIDRISKKVKHPKYFYKLSKESKEYISSESIKKRKEEEILREAEARCWRCSLCYSCTRFEKYKPISCIFYRD